MILWNCDDSRPWRNRKTTTASSPCEYVVPRRRRAASQEVDCKAIGKYVCETPLELVCIFKVSYGTDLLSYIDQMLMLMSWPTTSLLSCVTMEIQTLCELFAKPRFQISWKKTPLSSYKMCSMRFILNPIYLVLYLPADHLSLSARSQLGHRLHYMEIWVLQVPH